MARLLPASDRPVDGATPLRRRGVLHGWLVADAADDPGDGGGDSLADAWRSAQPIALPGVLAAEVAAARGAIADSLALLDHLRGGGRFLDAVREALADHPDLRLEGSTVDLLDAREIEKVFASGLVDGRRARGARDVWAKLGWVAHDEGDLSLRVRFSCGVERLGDWHENRIGMRWADRFAEALFPEGTVLAHSAVVREVLADAIAAPPWLSERIVYGNAPDGGAVFHHDADADQRGVAYAQLAGATAWLALPYADLHAAVLAAGRMGDGPALAKDAIADALDREDERELYALLNETPAFTARLADGGWLTVLEPGDVLLLPSAPGDRTRCAWHSVFALGDRPSLAHSYGVFAAPIAP